MKLPTDAVTMVRSACRRDVELASALVSSSKFFACIFVARLLRAEIAEKDLSPSSYFSTIRNTAGSDREAT